MYNYNNNYQNLYNQAGYYWQSGLQQPQGMNFYYQQQPFQNYFNNNGGNMVTNSIAGFQGGLGVFDNYQQVYMPKQDNFWVSQVPIQTQNKQQDQLVQTNKIEASKKIYQHKEEKIIKSPEFNRVVNLGKQFPSLNLESEKSQNESNSFSTTIEINTLISKKKRQDLIKIKTTPQPNSSFSALENQIKILNNSTLKASQFSTLRKKEIQQKKIVSKIEKKIKKKLIKKKNENYTKRIDTQIEQKQLRSRTLDRPISLALGQQNDNSKNILRIYQRAIYRFMLDHRQYCEDFLGFPLQDIQMQRRQIMGNVQSIREIKNLWINFTNLSDPKENLISKLVRIMTLKFLRQETATYFTSFELKIPNLLRYRSLLLKFLYSPDQFITLKLQD